MFTLQQNLGQADSSCFNEVVAQAKLSKDVDSFRMICCQLLLALVQRSWRFIIAIRFWCIDLCLAEVKPSNKLPFLSPKPRFDFFFGDEVLKVFPKYLAFCWAFRESWELWTYLQSANKVTFMFGSMFELLESQQLKTARTLDVPLEVESSQKQYSLFIVLSWNSMSWWFWLWFWFKAPFNVDGKLLSFST